MISEHSILHSFDHFSYIRFIVVNNLLSFSDKMHFAHVSAIFTAIAILASLWRSELMCSERIWKSMLLWRWRILSLVSFILLWYAEWWEMIERKIENRDLALFRLFEHIFSLWVLHQEKSQRQRSTSASHDSQRTRSQSALLILIQWMIKVLKV